MHRIYYALIETAAASVFLLPLFLLYEKYLRRSWKHTLLYLICGCYLAAVFALVGFPSLPYLYFDCSINPIPFVGMADDFINTCLNVLLFVPLGIFLPMLWEKYRTLKPTLCAAFCLSVFIEVSQLFTHRLTDINDILTNVFGAWLGYAAAKGLTGNFTQFVPSPAEEKDLHCILGAVVLILFFLQPILSSFLWEMIL